MNIFSLMLLYSLMTILIVALLAVTVRILQWPRTLKKKKKRKKKADDYELPF